MKSMARNPEEFERRYERAAEIVEELRSVPKAAAWRRHRDHPLAAFLETRLLGSLVQFLDEWRKDRAYATVDHWVLVHGRPFDPRPLPGGYRHGEPQRCYQNVVEAVERRRWKRGGKSFVYAEGFCSTGIIPFNHAWGLDEDGVVELTLRPRDGLPVTAECYWGVAFDQRFVLETLDARDCYGVIDAWDLGYPLLQDDKILERALIPLEEGA